MKKLNIAKRIKEVYIGGGLYIISLFYSPSRIGFVGIKHNRDKSFSIPYQEIPNHSIFWKQGLEFFQDNMDPKVKDSINYIHNYYNENIKEKD